MQNKLIVFLQTLGFKKVSDTLLIRERRDPKTGQLTGLEPDVIDNKGAYTDEMGWELIIRCPEHWVESYFSEEARKLRNDSRPDNQPREPQPGVIKNQLHQFVHLDAEDQLNFIEEAKDKGAFIYVLDNNLPIGNRRPPITISNISPDHIGHHSNSRWIENAVQANIGEWLGIDAWPRRR